MEWNETGTQSSSTESGPAMHQAKTKAREAATDAGRKVSEELRTRAETTKLRAADALGSVAQALSSSAQHLREDNNEGAPVDYVEKFGTQVRRASDYLRNTDTNDMVRSAEDFARRQPAVFLGGAFILGFLASRLVKSTQTPSTGGSIPHNRSLATQSSMWTGDREAAVSGFREPGSSSTFDTDSDPTYTRQFGRDTL